MNLIPPPGPLAPPAGQLLTTTGITDIYAATDNLTTVVAVNVASNAAGAVTLLLYYNNGTTDFLIWAQSYAAVTGSQYDIPVKMKSGDKIKATASVANQVTVTAVVATGMRQG